MTTDTNREAIEQLEEWFADNYSEDIAWGDLLTAALEETGLSLAKQATVPVVGEGELAPCPFCGGTAELRQQYHYGRDEPNGDWFVICPPCDLIRDQAFNVPREQAITAWNTRALARQDRQALPVGVEDAIAWIDDQCAALEYACAGDGDYEVYRLQNEKWRSIAALISRLSAQVHVWGRMWIGSPRFSSRIISFRAAPATFRLTLMLPKLESSPKPSQH